MGQMIDGVWSDENILTEIEADGRYQKKPSAFRDHISTDGASGFPAEPGRYVLYSSVACPWAQRTVLFRALKQLGDIIPLHNTQQNPDGGGWWFGGEKHRVPGTDTDVEFLHEIYGLADAGYTGKVTVPTLWDTQKKTVVNNESSEIIRMFNGAFAEFAESTPDYYAEPLRPQIDVMNDKILTGINNAVNGCGRVTSQEAYERSYDLLFATLDELDDLLGHQRYLCGDTQTESDWRFFPTLVRFDAIYYIGYKCNKRRVEDYPNLSNYVRDLYQTPGIAETCDLAEMKALVYRPGGPIASNGVVPKGPDTDFAGPHDRDRFSLAA